MRLFNRIYFHKIGTNKNCIASGCRHLSVVDFQGNGLSCYDIHLFPLRTSDPLDSRWLVSLWT